MDNLYIQLIAAAFLVAALINRKSENRMTICLFFLLISMSSFLLESTVGLKVSEIPQTSEFYLWAITLYYISVALLNFIVIFFVSIVWKSDYKWLFIPLIVCMVLNLLIPLELILITKSIDLEIINKNMSQFIDELRYIKRGYSNFAELISVIEIILLVVDNHGNRTRIKQLISNSFAFICSLPTAKALQKTLFEDER